MRAASGWQHGPGPRVGICHMWCQPAEWPRARGGEGGWGGQCLGLVPPGVLSVLNCAVQSACVGYMHRTHLQDLYPNLNLTPATTVMSPNARSRYGSAGPELPTKELPVGTNALASRHIFGALHPYSTLWWFGSLHQDSELPLLICSWRPGGSIP